MVATAVYNGEETDYFLVGRRYPIDIWQGFLRRVYVARVHSYYNDIVPETFVRYKNINEFLASWTDIKEEA